MQGKECKTSRDETEVATKLFLHCGEHPNVIDNIFFKK